MGAGILATPRTDDELAALRRERPEGWEYVLYAGTLLVERERHEPAFRSHLLRDAPPEGPPLGARSAMARLVASFPDLLAIIEGTTLLFDPDVQRRAFGPPGEPGDAALIEQLAERTIEGYRRFIDWGRALRATRVPVELRQAYRLAADLARQPVDDLRTFVDEAVVVMDGLMVQLADGTDEPVHLDLTLELSVDEFLVEQYLAEVERLSSGRTRDRTAAPGRRRWSR